MFLYSINVSVKRCGGGYGAKSMNSALLSTACAVAAYNLRVPVRMVVKLETNMEAFGKRIPLYGKYEVGINSSFIKHMYHTTENIRFLKL